MADEQTPNAAGTNVRQQKKTKQGTSNLNDLPLVDHISRLQVDRGHDPANHRQRSESTQKATMSFQETLKSWLHPHTFIFALVILTNLIIGVIRFGQTGDISVVRDLLPYVAGFVGLTAVKPLVKPLFLKGKKDNRQPVEDE